MNVVNYESCKCWNKCNRLSIRPRPILYCWDGWMIIECYWLGRRTWMKYLNVTCYWWNYDVYDVSVDLMLESSLDIMNGLLLCLSLSLVHGVCTKMYYCCY